VKPAPSKSRQATRLTQAWLASLALLIPIAVLADSVAGERIKQRGVVGDDYYAAGGVVDIDADIDGDVILAGGDWPSHNG
jgi:hypothetical protein